MSSLTPYSSGSLATIDKAELQKLLNKALEIPIKKNTYTAQITRNEQSAIVILVDQSGSMRNETFFKNERMTKAEAVALIINELFDTIISRCKKSEGIRDYFDLALIGYGGASNTEANVLWEGALEGREFVKVSELDQNFLEEREVQFEQNIRGQVRQSTRKIKTWIEPVANGLTPMKNALELAADLLEKWIIYHKGKDHFPPMVFNITDGEATDAKPDQLIETAERIKKIHTIDGHVLLLNIHLSDNTDQQVLFPSSFKEIASDANAITLYNMSSEMPSIFNLDISRIKKSDAMSKYIGMAYNTDMAGLLQILTIGTNTAMNQTNQGG